jgi:uncharacterized protein (TIGR01619 family)
MTDNWKPYLCEVNNKVASIFVNLGLRNSAPVMSKPWLLWMWVHFQTPRADGLSDGKEAPTLYKIEDALNLCVSRICRAIPCGRITTEGRREFYFYGETKDGFRKAVGDAMTGFEGYKFDLGEQKDLLWEQYLNVLYPSPEDLERIANMDLLDVLAEQGDIHTVAREVHHWMYFRSESSRSSFRDAVTGAGFRIVSESIVEGNLPPFCIVVARVQAIEQKLIDETVLELLRLVQRFEGEYAGWETQVVTQ